MVGIVADGGTCVLSPAAYKSDLVNIRHVKKRSSVLAEPQIYPKKVDRDSFR